ncbi:hypothetical protein LAZ67_2000291 [Cordylochernes scorpioides]|uniref:Uncharacterized protein n=1 Tax=Cordylochernes scorpioides TaxID=51811 RepID=A0ABY6K222_9ARAC|nr:hypothetical protein LAZ67_2000291 [Cordylochernes scorpioides]
MSRSAAQRPRLYFAQTPEVSYSGPGEEKIRGISKVEKSDSQEVKSAEVSKAGEVKDKKETKRNKVNYTYFASEGVPGTEIYQRPSVEYGNSVLPQWSVYKWIEKSKMAIVLHKTKVVDHHLLPQMRKTLNAHFCYKIIHNRLGFHKVCARWIPKQLTQLH